MFFPDGRIVTIVGHCGSGKSEISINLALLLASSTEEESRPDVSEKLDEEVFDVDKKVYIADLDIVNPYFRSREKADFLIEKNIGLIMSAEDFPGVDLPYMPGNMSMIFDNENIKAVIDAGGDPAGARVLARYAGELKRGDYPVYCVVNGNRPLTKKPEEVIKYIGDIEGASDLRITGLINNTHLLGSTELEDIYEGASLVKEISERTGLPIVGHAVEKRFIEEIEDTNERIINGEKVPKRVLIAPIIPIEIFLNKPWEV